MTERRCLCCAKTLDVRLFRRAGTGIQHFCVDCQDSGLVTERMRRIATANANAESMRRTRMRGRFRPMDLRPLHALMARL